MAQEHVAMITVLTTHFYGQIQTITMISKKKQNLASYISKFNTLTHGEWNACLWSTCE